MVELNASRSWGTDWCNLVKKQKEEMGWSWVWVVVARRWAQESNASKHLPVYWLQSQYIYRNAQWLQGEYYVHREDREGYLNGQIEIRIATVYCNSLQ